MTCNHGATLTARPLPWQARGFPTSLEATTTGLQSPLMPIRGLQRNADRTGLLRRSRPPRGQAHDIVRYQHPLRSGRTGSRVLHARRTLGVLRLPDRTRIVRLAARRTAIDSDLPRAQHERVHQWFGRPAGSDVVSTRLRVAHCLPERPSLRRTRRYDLRCALGGDTRSIAAACQVPHRCESSSRATSIRRFRWQMHPS